MEDSDACQSGDLRKGKFRNNMGNFTSMLYNEEGYTEKKWLLEEGLTFLDSATVVLPSRIAFIWKMATQPRSH